jgi:hypothetical protein
VTNALTTVQFHGATLFAVTIDLVHYVALKPICEALGLNWVGQLQRTKRDAVLRKGMCVTHMVEAEGPVFTATVDGLNPVSMATTDGLKPVSMATVAKDGKLREMVCLRLDKLDGWLFGVNSSRVKPELREKLNQYREECCAVLNSHFRGGPPPPPPQKRIPYEPPALELRPRPLNRADQRIVNLHAQRLANQAFYLVREHIRLRFEDEMRQFGYACIEEIVDDTDLSEAVNN